MAPCISVFSEIKIVVWMHTCASMLMRLTRRTFVSCGVNDFGTFFSVSRYWDKNGYLRGRKLEFQKWIIFWKYFLALNVLSSFLQIQYSFHIFEYLGAEISVDLFCIELPLSHFFFFHWLFVELATKKKKKKKRQHVMSVFRIGIQSAVITKILVKLCWAETKRGVRKIHNQNERINISTLKCKTDTRMIV